MKRYDIKLIWTVKFTKKNGDILEYKFKNDELANEFYKAIKPSLKPELSAEEIE